MRTTMGIAAVGLLLCASAASCTKKAQVHDELSAQAIDTEAPSEPTPETQPAAAPESPPPAATASTEAPPTYTGPTCPVACRTLRPHVRALTTDENARIDAALAPTMNGVRSCVHGGQEPSAQGAARPRKLPPINIRFSDQGDVIDLGIDSEGFDPGVESCLQSLAHGASPMPSVKLDSGAATVHCEERCEPPRAPQATTTKRVRRGPKSAAPPR